MTEELTDEQKLAEAIQQYLTVKGTEKTIELISRKLFALTVAHNELQEKKRWKQK